jgi:hypothetical protein
MQRLSSALAVLVAIAIVVITLAGLVYGIIEDPAVVGPLAAAAVVIAAGLLQRRWEKSRDLDKLHRDQMTPIYEQLAGMIKSIDEFVAKSPEELLAFYRQTGTALLLHGPSPVVRTWVAWQRSLGVASLADQMRTQEAFMRAIRTDLGLDNAALHSGDLLRLYINEEDDDEDRAVWREIRSRPALK